MKATLRTGHRVSAFADVYAASAAGQLSRSAWRRQGRIVPDDVIPSGIVVRKQGKARRKEGYWLDPILDDDSEDERYVQLVVDWFEVFTGDQPIPKENNRSEVTFTVLEEGKREPTGEGSLMTQKASETLKNTGDTSNEDESRKLSVNSIRAYVPEGLGLPDHCPVRQQIWWFLGLIYWKHLEQRLPWDEPVTLKYDYLKENIPNWPEVWRWCDGRRLVERSAGYIPGEKSYGYWSALPYRDQIHRLKTFEHKLLAKRLRQIEKKHLSRPVLRLLKDQLNRLSVDMDGFERQFGNHRDRHYYLAHLQTICDRELRFTKDDFSGRIHTNITNLYKPLRALLRVDGEPETLGETDIKNSQPLFLGLAAKANGVMDARYMALCESGEIYDHMASRLGVLRGSAKHEMLVFLYGKNGYRSTAKSVFRSEFPAMAEFIHETKKKDHRRLSRQMQIAERRFIVDTVCVRLFRTQKDLFVTTIHDALLARKSDCEFVASVMREEFAKLGVHPRLEWEAVGYGR